MTENMVARLRSMANDNPWLAAVANRIETLQAQVDILGDLLDELNQENDRLKNHD